jgi:hypothetical protein
LYLLSYFALEHFNPRIDLGKRPKGQTPKGWRLAWAGGFVGPRAIRQSWTILASLPKFSPQSLIWRKDDARSPKQQCVQTKILAEKQGEDMSNSRLLWPTQTQLRRRFELMDRMMRKRGVDTNAARRVDGGLALLDARAKCQYCRNEEACRRWLTIRAPRRPPDFCPNAAFFQTCPSAS